MWCDVRVGQLINVQVAYSLTCETRALFCGYIRVFLCDSLRFLHWCFVVLSNMRAARQVHILEIIHKHLCSTYAMLHFRDSRHIIQQVRCLIKNIALACLMFEILGLFILSLIFFNQDFIGLHYRRGLKA